MFGLGFGEFLVLLLVAMIVLGPKELPRYLRKAGQVAGKVRRFAYEMREKSGIDEVLRTEGLDRDLAEIRKLTRGELASLTSVVREATNFGPAPSPAKVNAFTAMLGVGERASSYLPQPPHHGPLPFAPARVVVERRHEYPSEGADAYGALPDTAAVYTASLARSPLADDPTYTCGLEERSANGVSTTPVQPATTQPATTNGEATAPIAVPSGSAHEESPAATVAEVAPPAANVAEVAPVAANVAEVASPAAEVSDEAWS